MTKYQTLVRLSYFMLALAIQVGCDNTEQLIKERNDAPEIELLIDGEPKGLFYEDSVKQSGKAGQFHFEFEIQVSDPNINFSRVDVSNETGKAFFLIQFDSLLIELKLEDANEDSSYFRLKAIYHDTGRHPIDFVAVDAFGKASVTTLEMTVFENLLPVAIPSVSRYEDTRFIRQIDLSASFDQDAFFGGRLVSYHYVIEGKEYAINLERMLHAFPEPGSFQVIVFVRDNNKDKSPDFPITIDIE